MPDKKNTTGDNNFSRKVAEFQDFIDAYGDELRILDDKEIKVLNLVSNGKSISHIAEKLDISITEVENHKKDIAQKLSLPREDSFLEYAVVSSLFRIWLNSLSLMEEKNIDVDFDLLDSEQS